MSSYNTAIDLTTQTIDSRARHYRNLVVAVAFMAIGSIAGAVIIRSWLPLSCMILLVPLCGTYLAIDAKSIELWRQKIFEFWEQRELDFSALYDAVMAISTLPRDTVESMLNTLPNTGDLVEEQGILADTRKAASAVATMILACRSDRIKLKTIEYTTVGSAVLIAVVLWLWQPLLGLLIIPSMRMLQAILKKSRINNTREILAVAKDQVDFSPEQYIAILKKIDHYPISDAEMRAL